MDFNTLRVKIARALYEEPGSGAKWESLHRDARVAWLDDADRVIEIIKTDVSVIRASLTVCRKAIRRIAYGLDDHPANHIAQETLDELMDIQTKKNVYLKGLDYDAVAAERNRAQHACEQIVNRLKQISPQIVCVGCGGQPVISFNPPVCAECAHTIECSNNKIVE